MGIERRVITTPDAVSQRIIVPKTTTTDATVTTIYTSQSVIVELRRIYMRAIVLVSTPDASALSSIIVEGTMARATGGSLRLVDANFQRASGEIKANEASAAISVNPATNRFLVTVTGKAATTYEWFAMIDLFRSN